MKKSNAIKPALIAFMLLSPVLISADTVKSVSPFSNPLFDTLLAVIIVLTIIVISLASVLKNISSSKMIEEKFKNMKQTATKKSVSGVVMLAFFSMLCNPLSAETQALQNQASVGGVAQPTFYLMIAIIIVELIVTGIFMYLIKDFLATDEIKRKPVTIEKPVTSVIYSKLLDAVEVEKEESILLDHSYDGIRELDNNLPPWWKYSFYLTIVISVIYLFNYHVIKTSPLQAEEYTISVKKAEAEIAEFMKNSANNVDETTVKLLTDASDLSAGKELFMNNCAACHGRSGEGTVGPNLTDEYWIHSGGVSDIFKTIKYGWPDKGMKSWKEDFSPIQIAQITSFIKTLNGTNPPNAKEKQGDLYVEEIIPSDTLIVNDTVKTVASTLPQ